jgi:2-amino-4-hydroxy-6-hydroxymethyldihydropteridine diphosphokinase
MATGYLLLGTNLGDREHNLQQALKVISDGNCTIIKTSSVYESEPWGYSDPNPYFNLAVKVSTELSPEQLLERCLCTEKLLGRMRNSKNYEARIIDIDILFYDNVIIQSNNLQIPHPKIPLRRFVLMPLSAINPDFVHPILVKTIKQLLEECEDKGWVRKVKNLSA